LPKIWLYVFTKFVDFGGSLMILYAKCENLDHLKDAAVDNRSPSATVQRLERSATFSMETPLLYIVVVQ
jgi:hypothetical protein